MFKKNLFAVVLLLITSSVGLTKNKINTYNALLSVQVPQDNPTPESNPLFYYGGPVIANVKVFVGLWNNRVSAEVKNNILDFYTAYVNSEHMDWLNEYQTNIQAIDGRSGTNQQIGRGQVLGQKIMTASIADKRITDIQIQQEIEKQIDAGNFPRPDKDTLYMMHFSKDMQISVDGMTSCFSFGGYHNGFTSAKYGNIFYGVLPECSGFSGGGFSSITFVSSHELIEAVTDAFPTPGDKPAFPQAWNARDGSEIADICQSGSTTLKGPKANYNISLEWSNSRNICYDGK